MTPLPVGWLLCVGWLFFGCLGGDASQVAVFESVAVSFEVDDLCVVDEAVDHGGGDHVVAEHLAPAPEGLLLVTIKLALSYLAETSWKNRLAASGSNGI